jgi:acid stress chaperone HdeB
VTSDDETQRDGELIFDAQEGCEYGIGEFQGLRHSGVLRLVKMISAVLVAAALMAAAPVQAQVIDLSTVRCKEFVDSRKDTINAILMWLEGYYTDEEDPAIIDFGKMKEKAEQLTTYCAQNPTIGIMTAAESVMAK